MEPDVQSVVGAAWERFDVPGLGLPHPVPRALGIADWLELSCAQERFWLMEQVRPGATSHLVPLVVGLTGRLDLASLRRALDAVVNRHEMLRVAFGSDGGRPMQRVDAHARVDLECDDWATGLPIPPPAVAIDRWVQGVASQPFQLHRAPLLRAALLRLRAGEHLLVLVSHRLVADAWSMRVLFDDLAVGYGALSGGDDADFPDVLIRLTDLAAWQQEVLRSGGYDRDLHYWLTRLADGNHAVAPPADRCPSAESAPAVGRRRVPLADAVLDGLASQFTDQASSPVVLLAAFAQLLARYSGENDLTVALPVACRSHSKLQSLVGPLQNIVVLRAELSDNPTFRQFVSRMAAFVSTSLARRSVPVELLLARFMPESYVEPGPLATAAFDIGDARPAGIDSAGLHMRVLDIAHATTDYPLTLRVMSSGHGYSVEADYRNDWFSQEFIDAFIDAYQVLLRRVVANPDVRVQDVSLGAPGRRTIPMAVGRKQMIRRYPLVTELIERATERNPYAPMLVRGDLSWSYRELHDRAIELADTLRSIGSVPGETVAVCPYARGFELYASLLGVWHAGGVVALVNAALPYRECKTLLGRARARTLLVIGDEPPHWWCTEAVHNVLLISPDRGPVILRRSRGSARPFAGDSPAYIFFTSGTTGTPKALLGSHNSLSHFLLWQQKEFDVTTGDRCAQLTSLFTDGALRDIFTPLVSGCSLHLPADPAIHPGDATVLRWLKKSAVTLAHTMPSLSTRWLAETDAVGSLDALRLLFFSGEPLTGGLASKWHGLAPQADIVNLYGVSECTMIQAFHRVCRTSDERVHPAGNTMRGVQMFVLTPSGTPCAAGEVGQLHIRTPYATLGYIGQDEPTFIPNPFRDDPTDRVFRTGDQARIRMDGALEVLGRSSGSERVRGVTVNSEQVNAVLAGQPGVRASAVVRISRVDHSPCLVAFVVPAQPRTTSTRRLRHHLRTQIPAAAVPAYIVLVPELPVTAVGKLDRHQLRCTFASHQASIGASSLAGATGQMVVDSWSAVLGITCTDPQAHFFDLGGSPRQAVQLAARLQNDLAIPLDLDTLFYAPVLSEFARIVSDVSSSTGALDSRPAPEPRPER